MEFCRPNSVPNYVLLLQSNLTLVGPSQVVAIVDANCSTVKNFLKNSSISICISVQAWEEGGEEPQNAEFIFFLWVWGAQNILPGIIRLLCVS